MKASRGMMLPTYGQPLVMRQRPMPVPGPGEIRLRISASGIGAQILWLVPEIGIETQVSPYPLADANRALADLRKRRLIGAAVLTI